MKIKKVTYTYPENQITSGLFSISTHEDQFKEITKNPEEDSINEVDIESMDQENFIIPANNGFKNFEFSFTIKLN